jgi:hypothetical protein
MKWPSEALQEKRTRTARTLACVSAAAKAQAERSTISSGSTSSQIASAPIDNTAAAVTLAGDLRSGVDADMADATIGALSAATREP